MILPKDGLSVPRRDLSEAFRDVELPRPIGSQIGEYLLDAVVGQSTRSVVYRASSAGLTVVLKLFREGESFDPGVVRRFMKDSSISITHLSLAPVETLGQDDGLWYYVRPFYRGDSLELLLDDIDSGHSSAVHLSPLAPGRGRSRPRGFVRDALAQTSSVAEALAVAHGSGGTPPILHGRIHPRNLIFSPSGRLMLCDFEGTPMMNRRFSDESEILDYWPPEQIDAVARGKSVSPDTASDVYALSAVLHRLVCGRFPTPGDETTGGVAAELGGVLSKATALDPSERYTSASAFADDLLHVLDIEPTLAGENPTRGDATYRESGRVKLRVSHPPEYETLHEDLGAVVEIGVDVEPIATGPGAEPVQLAAEEFEAVEDAVARATLLEEPPPPAHRSNGNPSLLATAIFGTFLLVLGAGILSTLTLYDRSEMYRWQTDVLRKESSLLKGGIEGLSNTVTALAAGNNSAAAAALAETHKSLVLPTTLSHAETQIRFRDRDPVLAGLEDRRPSVRAASVDSLHAAVQSGVRPPDELHQLTNLLHDDDTATRHRAVRALIGNGLSDVVLNAYLSHADSRDAALDEELFLTFYQALTTAASEGDPVALAAFRHIDVEALFALDRAREHTTQGTTLLIGLSPGFLVQVDGEFDETVDNDKLVTAWLETQGCLGNDELFAALPLFTTRDELLPAVVRALEEHGGEQAIKSLNTIAQHHWVHVGREVVNVLDRLDAVDDLLGLAASSLPLSVRSVALERAVAAARPSDLVKIAGAMTTHPDARIRTTAFLGLEEIGYFRGHVAPLLEALGDPVLRVLALQNLQSEPQIEVFPKLVNLLETQDSRARVWVHRALFATLLDRHQLVPLARHLFNTRRFLLLGMVKLADLAQSLTTARD